MTRIGALFEKLRATGRKGLIAYLTAGDPSPERTPALVEALERGGADLIELGVPFSDPIADGPVIQRAGERALRAGTTLRKVLDIAREIRNALGNPAAAVHLFESGAALRIGRLARDAAACGIDGCLLTDASVEEAGEYVRVMRGRGARHRVPGGADEFAAAPGTGGAIFERVRLPGFAHRRDGRARFAFRMPSGRWCERCARSRSCRWRWASAFRGRNTWPSWGGRWRRWWWAARSCI